MYIISPFEAVSHHAPACIYLQLDDIQHFVLMICNSFGIDDIHAFGVIGCEIAERSPQRRNRIAVPHSRQIIAKQKSKSKPKHLNREVLFLSYGGEDLKRQKSNLGKKKRRIVLNFFFHRGRIVLLFDRNLY